jgi:hypothetical protein
MLNQVGHVITTVFWKFICLDYTAFNDSDQWNEKVLNIWFGLIGGAIFGFSWKDWGNPWKLLGMIASLMGQYLNPGFLNTKQDGIL